MPYGFAQHKLKGFNDHHKETLKLEKAELLLLKNADEAFQLAIDVLNHAKTGTEIYARANYVIGKYHFLNNEYDEALLCLSKAEEVQKQQDPSIDFIQTLLLKGQAYDHKNRSDTAILVAKYGLKLLQSDNSTIYVSLNELIANAFIKINRGDSGLVYFNKILPILKEKQNYAKLGEIHHNIGYYFKQQYNYDKALTYFYDALEYCSISENYIYLARCYNKIGLINLRLELYDEAMDSFQKSIEIRRVHGDNSALAITYNNLGLVYKHKGDVSQAFKAFYKGLAFAQVCDNELNVAIVNTNLGLLNQMQQSYDTAIQHLLVSHSIYIKKNENNRAANACNNLAATYVKSGNFDLANEYAIKSIQLSDSNQSLEVKKELFELLYVINKEQGKNKVALGYLERYKTISDSLDKTIRKKLNEDLSLRLYIKHKQKEYKELIAQNKVQSKQINQKDNLIQKQRRFIISFISIVTLLSLSSVYIFMLFFQKRKAHRLLMHRNRLIEKQKKEIEQQKENLATINYELEKMSVIAEKTNNAVAIMDKEGSFIWVNNGFTKMYGYNLQELKSAVASNIFEANDVYALAPKMKKLRELKTPVIYDFLGVCKDGSKIWAQTTLTPLLDENGEIYRYIAIDTDISELKKAEQKIKTQHKEIQEYTNELLAVNEELQKLSIIAEKTNNSVILIDSNGQIEWVNNSFTDIYGFSLSEIKGREYKQLVKEYFSLDIKKLVNVWFGNKAPVSYESLNNTKEGNKIWVNTSLTPILSDKGDLLKMVVIDSDITAIKKAEQELKRINKDITSSISYAQRIQMAFMPNENMLADHFQSHYILFEPKDIVSGDFYWFTHHNNKTIVVAADCTGHGVPGAFMSLIGISSLNKIIKEQNITSTALILYQLRVAITEALGQKGEIGETSDGMDISIAAFDRTNKSVEISAAMNQLLLYQDKKLNTIKGDRISIGHDQMEKGFSSQVFPLEKGDKVYMFSDGFIDQFGGVDNQKLKNKRFKDYVATIANDPMPMQKKKMQAFLNNWKGSNPQLDDNLLIALEY